MKLFSRNQRRIEARRRKQRAERLGRSIKHADHLASCSCLMCGNPRKWMKEKTIQEQKNDRLFFEEFMAL